MSYKSREARRRKRAALASSSGGAERTARYWLTVTRRTTCCARCAGRLVKGGNMVYRRIPEEWLCVPCADREGISYRPSRRWERSRPVVRRAERRAA